MTKDQFVQDIGNNYRFNYLRFCQADKYNKSLSTRAYINFLNEDDMYDFKNVMENRAFIDEIGNETYCIIEFAVFQKIPGKSKVDSKQNTIAVDPEFMKFAEDLKEPPKHINIGSVESNLEEIKNKESDRMNIKTPLIEYLSNIPKKERTKKDDYRRKPDYNKNFSKKDAENNESKVTSKMDIKSVKKNSTKDGVIDAPSGKGGDMGKQRPAEKCEPKKGKANQRNDIKAYAAAYEDYEYEVRCFVRGGVNVAFVSFCMGDIDIIYGVESSFAWHGPLHNVVTWLAVCIDVVIWNICRLDDI